jgi:LysR family hca operon transcriptional activator
MRREAQAPGLSFKTLMREPLLVVLPTAHRLAARKTIRPQDLSDVPYIAPVKTAPALKAVIDAYAKQNRIALQADYEAENLSMAMSLVASTGGFTLLPQYAGNLLSSAVVMRPLHGDAPSIELVVGYSRSGTQPLLKRFLARLDDLSDHPEH